MCQYEDICLDIPTPLPLPRTVGGPGQCDMGTLDTAAPAAMNNGRVATLTEDNSVDNSNSNNTTGQLQQS